MNNYLNKFNVQIAKISFLILSNFLCFNSVILSVILAAKRGKSAMSFKSSIGPIHSVSNISTSYILQVKKTRNKSRFSNQDRKGIVSYIMGVKCLSGCIEVRDHEIYQNKSKSPHFMIFNKLENVYIHIALISFD